VISNIIIDLLSISPFGACVPNEAVFTLPFLLIRQLHIPKRELWRLVFIFSLGGLAILMSISRIIALAVSATTAQVAVWTALECSTAIMVSCCPALRPLFSRRTGGTNSSSSHPEISQPSKGDSANDTLGDLALATFGEDDIEVGDRETLMVNHSPPSITKKVEFEIMRERASEVPSRRYTEVWETLEIPSESDVEMPKRRFTEIW